MNGNAKMQQKFFQAYQHRLFLFDALRDQTIRSMLIRPATPLPYPLWT
jgi:hypothetical protein